MEHLRVLILNSTYEPLQFCNARRAIVMVLKGKAEQMECDGKVFRSPTISFRLPTVIRLVNFINIPYKGIVSFSKKNVFRRDNHTCQYCGKNHGELTIDHILPKSRGGGTSWDNVVVACQECNLRKGNRTPGEVGIRLLKKPYTPHFLIHNSVYNSAPKSFIESWSKYISLKPPLV
ncbi:MAG: HNH endonuclease [Nitrospinae bacterium]|nr:HNH endonuclease [Nitrospinota bacterium]